MRKSTAFDAFAEGSYQGFFPIGAVLLRLLIGLLFFFAGWSKFTAEAWSAAGFLQNATGPFASWFQGLAGNGVVDVLNMWGLTLIGLALVLGLCVRTASFFGIVVMGLYYVADFVGNTAHGFIGEHIIYASVLALFLVGGFGHVCGLDGLLERRLDSRTKWIKLFLG
ncbi:DoxX family membrane protein [Patescibacteria group bacterium]|nr:MAG: DoxX family membrane protein [Patescibacteria group bacterium]